MQNISEAEGLNFSQDKSNIQVIKKWSENPPNLTVWIMNS